MIVEFSVTNFGSIRDTQTLSMIADPDDTLSDYYVVPTGGLRLLKLAVIYGPNASGKTMVLKALETLRILATRPRTQKLQIIGVTPFLFDEKTAKSPTIFRLVFIQRDIRYDYTVEVTSLYVVREKMLYFPRGREAELFKRETDTEKQVATISIGSTVRLNTKVLSILEGNVLWNDTVLGAFSKSNIDWPEMHEIKKWFDEKFDMLLQPQMNLREFADKALVHSPEYKSLIVKFLEKADVQTSDVKILTEEKDLGDGHVILTKPEETPDVISPDNIKLPVKDMKMKSELLVFTHAVKNNSGLISHYDLPWNFQSHGTQRYYGLAAVMANMISVPKVTPIDEFESALHPDLMKHFILTFLANAKQSQLLLTTHNVHLLSEKDILRKDAIWFTQKRSDGSTELYSLADFDSSIFRKNSSVINAYKTGKLGAVPQTGSIFLPQLQ